MAPVAGAHQRFAQAASSRPCRPRNFGSAARGHSPGLGLGRRRPWFSCRSSPNRGARLSRPAPHPQCQPPVRQKRHGPRIAHQAIHYPGSEIIIASPGQRQSGELFYKVKSLLPKLGLRAKTDRINEHSLLFPNGSRIVGLPDAPDHVRGFSGTALLIIDEAAYASAELYVAVMPFLATSNGTMWVISTPRGQSGLFYDLWHNEKLTHWRRFRLTADQCPRISAEFLAEMKLIHPARYWEEFMCEFRAASTQVFDRETLDRCQDDAYEPFFGNGV